MHKSRSQIVIIDLFTANGLPDAMVKQGASAMPADPSNGTFLMKWDFFPLRSEISLANSGASDKITHAWYSESSRFLKNHN